MRQELLTQHLIVFLRHPTPGLVKTRLIPALGPMGTAALQRWMGEKTIATACRAAPSLPATVEIRHTGAPAEDFQEWLGVAGKCLRPQADGDLGQRMAEAFAAAFAEGAERVVLIGADCPALSAEILTKAFEHLRGADLVLGPAFDGGYYLIGLKHYSPQLFTGIVWGNGEVLSETVRRAEASRLSVALLETLPDIDRPEDVNLLPGYGYRVRGET